MYYVYVMRSKTRNYIYIGLTSNLGQRFNAHQKGYEETTAPYRPFELIYSETHQTRQQAREREKHFKIRSVKEAFKEHAVVVKWYTR